MQEGKNEKGLWGFQRQLRDGGIVRELADHLGLHYSTVSRLINEADLKISKLKT